MNKIVDNKQNIQIVYLYVEEFEWTISFDKERANGHPKPKRVYRAAYNKETDSYRLLYEVDDANNKFRAIFVPALNNTEEMRGYTSKIKVLSIDTILEFDLSEEDLDNLNKWMDTNNKDFFEVMYGPKKKPTQITAFPLPEENILPEAELPEGITNTVSVDSFDALIEKLLTAHGDKELKDFWTDAAMIRDINPAMFTAISQLLFFLTSDEADRFESAIDPFWVHMDDRLGSGANISAAMAKLVVYTCADRRKNFDEKDLLGAIKYLLMEKQRINLKKDDQ